MDQQLGNLTQQLTELVCQGLGTPQPASTILRLKLQALKSGIASQPQPTSDLDYARAVQELSARVSNREAFEAAVRRLQLRNIKGHRELVTLLNILATDDTLQVLNKPFSSQRTGSDDIAGLSRAGGQVQQQHPHVTQADMPSALAAPQPRTNSTASLRQVAAADGMRTPLFSLPTVATPAPPISAIGNGVGESAARASTQPWPSAPPADYPAQVSAVGPAPGAGDTTAANRVSGSARIAPEVPHTGVSSRLGSTHEARPTAFYSSSNPVYGQEDAHSPAVRAKDYTPTLAPSITAARRRAASVEPRPSVAAVGDLFTIPSQQQPQHQQRHPHSTSAGVLHPGRAPVSNSSSPPLLVPLQRSPVPPHGQPAARLLAALRASLPAWNVERPHLTGLDLVAAAAANSGIVLDGSGDMPSTPSKGSNHVDTAAALAAAAQVAADQLTTLPPEVQELAVMNDLLYAFMGLDGKYVRAKLVDSSRPGGGPPPSSGQSYTIAYTIQAALEPCTLELVERVLPICEYVAVLQRFIETRSTLNYGLVSHAVAAALRSLLSDWLLIVTQLEHQLRLGRLSLQGLVYYCQGPIASLALLAGTAAEAASRHLTSAGLLNLLHTKASALAGDRAGRAIMHRLLQAAAAPYFRMLERWIVDGVLEDPHSEFCICEDQAVTKEALTEDHQLAYWHLRYSIRTAPAGTAGTGAEPEAHTRQQQTGTSGLELDVPVFLLSHATLILTTGKYLNAVRECGRPAPRALPVGQRLVFDPGHGYLGHLLAAHASASASLLQLVVQEQGLTGWLRSLKHFFLMDQGDMVVHLAEAASEELDKCARDISRPRLQSLLELAVRTSSLAQDPHVDSLVLDLDPRSLLELARAAGAVPTTTAPPSSVHTPSATPAGHTAAAAADGGSLRLAPRSRGEDLPGWEVVMMSCPLVWPLTLVIPPQALATYQLIFRHLFSLKHAERQLAAAWHRMQTARNAHKTAQDGLKPAHALVQKYLFLIQEIVRYSTMDVLEPAWRGMEGRMRKASDLDQVIQCHQAFLARATDGLLLSRPRLLRPLLGLQQGAFAFCGRIKAAWDALAQEQAAAAAASAPPQRPPSGSGAGAGSRSGGGGGARTGSGNLGGAAANLQRGLSISERRTQQYASLGGAGTSGSAHIDIGPLTADFTTRLSELLAGLRDMAAAAMRREAGSGTAPQGSISASAPQDTLETREELEALQGLIERLELDAQSKAASYAAGAPGQASQLPAGQSTRELYQALASRAAALQ